MTKPKLSSQKQCLAGITKIPLAVIAAGILFGQNMVSAADTKSSATETAAAQSSEAKSGKSATEVALKDMRDVLRHLHRAALDLISEVEQRDMVVVGEPLLIEPIPEKKDPHPGTMEEMIVLGDAQPPRKKWLDITMAELEKLTTLLAQERQAMVIPSDRQSALSAPIKELDDRLAAIQKHYTNLKGLTQGPKYKNIEIGKEALGIYEDSARVEKPWRDILSAVRSKS